MTPSSIVTKLTVIRIHWLAIVLTMVSQQRNRHFQPSDIKILMDVIMQPFQVKKINICKSLDGALSFYKTVAKLQHNY